MAWQERDGRQTEGREQDSGTVGRREELGRDLRKEIPGEERAQGHGEGDGGEGLQGAARNMGSGTERAERAGGRTE